jgi:hypothetical protein
MDVKTPTPQLVKEYLNLWVSLDNYRLQESSLEKLFIKTYPENKDMDDVLIKVCSLNDFYSTNIFSPFNVAKHIVDLDIDKRLSNGDMSLVNEIAIVKVNDSKTMNFYSFATKYCSHHKPEIYPIYDSYVDKLLRHYRKEDKFYKFKNDDLKIYSNFKNILLEFQKFYHLGDFTLKEIDKFLWQHGKECFPRKYKKK